MPVGTQYRLTFKEHAPARIKPDYEIFTPATYTLLNVHYPKLSKKILDAQTMNAQVTSTASPDMTRQIIEQNTEAMTRLFSKLYPQSQQQQIQQCPQQQTMTLMGLNKLIERFQNTSYVVDCNKNTGNLVACVDSNILFNEGHQGGIIDTMHQNLGNMHSK